MAGILGWPDPNNIGMSEADYGGFGSTGRKLKAGILGQLVDGVTNALAVPGDVWRGVLDVKPETPGMWSDVDEARQQATQKTVDERSQDLAGLAMTGGIPWRVPGTTLTSGVKLPKAVGGYHETWSPEEFTKFKPSDHDLGTHFAVDPLAPRAADYAQLWRLAEGTTPDPTKPVKPRTMPVVADIQKSLKFPYDVGNWKEPRNLIGSMEEDIRFGKTVPLGLLRDTMWADKQPGGIGKNFIPMLQDKGFDSLYYPHVSERYMGESPKYNTFMVLDENKIHPRYSEAGQELIKQRGVHEPMKRHFYDLEAERGNWNSDQMRSHMRDIVDEPWRIPQGILKPYAEHVPGQKGILDAEIAKARTDEFNAWLSKTSQQKQLQEFYDQGIVSSKEYIETYNKIHGENAFKATYGEGFAPKKTQDIKFTGPSPLKEKPFEVKAYDDFKSGKISQEEYLRSFDDVYKIKEASDYAKKMDYLKKLDKEQLKYHLGDGLITKEEYDKLVPTAPPSTLDIINAKPASEKDIKDWGLKPGATNKDLQDAMEKWADKQPLLKDLNKPKTKKDIAKEMEGLLSIKKK